MTVIDSAPAAAVLLDGLTSVQETLARLALIDLHEVPGETVREVLDGIETVKRQSEALSARALATIETDGTWALDGARSMAAWYRHRSGKHHSSAAKEIRQARALRDHLPQTAKALAAGQISIDHAGAIVRSATTTAARLDKLKDPDVGEGMLLDHARRLDASSFTIAASRWGLRADPDGADRAYREDSAAENFYLAETTDGYVPGGWLSKASGMVVLKALEARIGVPAKGDRRTPGQRRAAALTGLAHLALDSGVLRPGARIRPHVAVTVPFETLERLVAASRPTHRPGCPVTAGPPTGSFGQADGTGGADGAGAHGAEGVGSEGVGGVGGAGEEPGDVFAPVTGEPGTGAGARAVERPSGASSCGCGSDAVISTEIDRAAMAEVEPATFEDGTPLAPSLLGRLACASAMHRVVFGPESEVLDVGREKRLFTAAQTRAITARDKHCQYPQCNAPPGDGEIHHSIYWWAHHGATSVKLGVLLCWFHHDFVHAHDVRIERRRRGWSFYRKDGSEIEDPRSAAATRST